MPSLSTLQNETNERIKMQLRKIGLQQCKVMGLLKERKTQEGRHTLWGGGGRGREGSSSSSSRAGQGRDAVE